MRRVRLMAAGLCVSIASAVIANAQPYPSRIIKLIVPYPPGGVVDITGRLLANQLQKELSATVIVENKPGAGGTLGVPTSPPRPSQTATSSCSAVPRRMPSRHRSSRTCHTTRSQISCPSPRSRKGRWASPSLPTRVSTISPDL
jgi:hypothetical protein